MTTTTTTTATKQAAASPALPSPPCSFQEDSTTSELKELAVEKDMSVGDAFIEKEFELASNEPAITHDHFDPDSDPQADWNASAAQHRVELAEKNGTDVFHAFLGLDVPTTEAEKEKRGDGEAKIPWTPRAEDVNGKALRPITIALLDQNRYFLEGLSWHNTALLEQNRFLIEQLAKQNKFTVQRLLPLPFTPCVACGSGDLKSGGSEKKKSKTLSWKVDTVIRRILRTFSLVLLVVIAMQLGFIRGQSFEERNVRRTGFFGR